MRFQYHKLPAQKPVSHEPPCAQKNNVDTRAVLLLASVMNADTVEAMLAVEPFLRPCDQIAVNSALQAKCAAEQMAESARIRCAIANANCRHARDEFDMLDALGNCKPMQQNPMGPKLKQTAAACRRAKQLSNTMRSGNPTHLLLEMMGKNNPMLNLLNGGGAEAIMRMMMQK